LILWSDVGLIESEAVRVSGILMVTDVPLKTTVSPGKPMILFMKLTEVSLGYLKMTI